MEYSIIIPFHSNRTYLELCLTSLENTVPKSVEIIIVVNNSKQDKTLQINKERFKVLSVNQNIGYSKAINLGANTATGKYLIFCDSDTVYLQADWFYNLTTFYTLNKNVGIASSKLVNPTSNRIIEFGMALSKYNNIHPFMDRPISFEPTKNNRRVQMACSANMIIEKDLFLRMGMLDVDLFNYYQDNDLCLRLKDFKKECWVVANSVAYHKGSSCDINKASYRADIKGYYMAKNFHRMDLDLQEYFKINYEYFRLHEKINNDKTRYLLIDISTVADDEWYYDVIKKYFSIYDIYELRHPVRDTEYLSLIDFLGVNILKTDVPIIYFVDRYISLNKNSLWRKLRNCNSDIIIDRNTNIVGFANLENN